MSPELVQRLIFGLPLLTLWTWTLALAVRHPRDRWAEAGRNKDLWTWAHVLLGLPVSVAFLVAVQPQLQRARHRLTLAALRLSGSAPAGEDPHHPRHLFQRVEMLEDLTLVLPAWGPALDLLASTIASAGETTAVVVVTGEHDEVPPLPRPVEVVRIPSPTFASAVNAGVEVADRPYVAHMRPGFTYVEEAGPLRLMLELGNYPGAVAATGASYDGRCQDGGIGERGTVWGTFLASGKEKRRALGLGGRYYLLFRPGIALQSGTVVRRDVMPRLEEGRYADWRAALEVRRSGRVLTTVFPLAKRWVDFSPEHHPGPELVVGMPAHVRLAGAVARWLDTSPRAAAAARAGRAVRGGLKRVAQLRHWTPDVVERWHEWNESHVPWIDRHPRLRLALLPSVLAIAGAVVLLTLGWGSVVRFVLVPGLALVAANAWAYAMIHLHQEFHRRWILSHHARTATGLSSLQWPAGRVERLQGATFAAALGGRVLAVVVVVAVVVGVLP